MARDCKRLHSGPSRTTRLPSGGPPAPSGLPVRYRIGVAGAVGIVPSEMLSEPGVTVLARATAGPTQPVTAFVTDPLPTAVNAFGQS